MEQNLAEAMAHVLTPFTNSLHAAWIQVVDQLSREQDIALTPQQLLAIARSESSLAVPEGNIRAYLADGRLGWVPTSVPAQVVNRRERRRRFREGIEVPRPWTGDSWYDGERLAPYLGIQVLEEGRITAPPRTTMLPGIFHTLARDHEGPMRNLTFDAGGWGWAPQLRNLGLVWNQPYNLQVEEDFLAPAAFYDTDIRLDRAQPVLTGGLIDAAIAQIRAGASLEFLGGGHHTNEERQYRAFLRGPLNADLADVFHQHMVEMQVVQQPGKRPQIAHYTCSQLFLPRRAPLEDSFYKGTHARVWTPWVCDQVKMPDGCYACRYQQKHTEDRVRRELTWGVGLQGGALLQELVHPVTGESLSPRMSRAKRLFDSRIHLPGGGWRKLVVHHYESERRYAAELRAEGLLERVLRPEEYTNWRQHGWFRIRGSDGELYVLDDESSFSVTHMVDERGWRAVNRYCFTTDDDDAPLPLADRIVAQVLALRSDAETVLREVANIANPSDAINYEQFHVLYLDDDERKRQTRLAGGPHKQELTACRRS